MIWMGNDFIITNHAKERYLIRTRQEYSHLEKCHKKCPQCKVIIQALKREIKRLGTKLNAEIIARLLHAKEDRSYLNDSNFMTRHYEKHGFERVKFLVHEEWRKFPAITFVVIGNNKVITCLYARHHISGRVLFKKRKKKYKRRKEVQCKDQDKSNYAKYLSDETKI